MSAFDPKRTSNASGRYRRELERLGAFDLKCPGSSPRSQALRKSQLRRQGPRTIRDVTTIRLTGLPDKY